MRLQYIYKPRAILWTMLSKSLLLVDSDGGLIGHSAAVQLRMLGWLGKCAARKLAMGITKLIAAGIWKVSRDRLCEAWQILLILSRQGGDEVNYDVFIELIATRPAHRKGTSVPAQCTCVRV